MRWLIRRFLKRIKQRFPIEVYVNGKLIIAGGGIIQKTLKSKYDTIIKIERL